MSIVCASWAVDIEGDMNVPKLSLSKYTHIATCSPCETAGVHAASPPIAPVGTTDACGYVCSKLASEDAGSLLARLPPTNMNTCWVPPVPGAASPVEYKAETTFDAWPALVCMTSSRSWLTFIAFSRLGLRV